MPKMKCEISKQNSKILKKPENVERPPNCNCQGKTVTAL